MSETKASQMKKITFAAKTLGALMFIAAALPSAAQSSKDSAATAAGALPSKADLAELSKPGANHKLLASLNGTWSFVGKHTIPGPAKRSFEFKGTIVRKEWWGGRYFITETTGGKIKMAWSESELIPYNDKIIEGYDNVKKKFVTASINNELDTGIITTEGTYNPATKTFVYDGETISHIHRDIPVGTKFKFHDVVKIIDDNHYVFERHEIVNGQEIISTELSYTRIKSI